MNTPLIYIVAGEASGDILGARLIEALKKQLPDARFAGIGGAHMFAQGFYSLFPMQELSLMGFVEVLPHALRLKKRIKQTVTDIQEKQPDILITIDSPGFTFRVARALKEAKSIVPRVHYVAPTVWAYKPERAKKTAELFNYLLTILPFEAPYFEEHNLPTTFVGHPAAWDWRECYHNPTAMGAAFRAQHNIAEDAMVVGCMPGSRKGELKHHLPVFGRSLYLLHRTQRDMHIVIPTQIHLKDQIEKVVRRWGVPYHITCDPEEKQAAFAACNVALAKSGTVTVEAAMAQLPMITAYKGNPVSAAIVRRLITIPYVNLLNILSKKEVIPEFLQEKCRAKYLAPALEELINNGHKRAGQIEASYAALIALGLKQERVPAELAAEVVMKYME